MAGSRDRATMMLLVVDGTNAARVHRSVLDRAAELADGLGRRTAAALAGAPVSFTGAELARLRRDLEQVVAFADATRRVGWVLGELSAAPGRHPELVLETPSGDLWAHPLRGFELRLPEGTRPVAEAWGPARRAALTELLEPLARAAARAEILEIRGEGG